MPPHTYSMPAQCKKPEAPPPKPSEIWQLMSKRSLPYKICRPAQLAALATVPAPASIIELARALKSDVDIIYEWVYSNIDYYSMWGLHKGPLGAIIDRIGNSFEQSAVMVALLRQAGYTANFVAGTIRLTRVQIEQLLGTTETIDNHTSETILSFAQIPYEATYDIDGLLDYVDMSHVWVQVDISGTNYVFDPTIKTFDYVSGVDLSTILGYDETTLLEAALDGATEGDVYVQNLNSANIQDAFKTYGLNLLDWIKTNAFDASLNQIIGGRTIQPLAVQPVRQTELPYQAPGAPITIWTDIPDEYRATYSLQFADIDETFFTDEIYSKRLTITFNASVEPELRLDGTLIATGTAQTPNEFVGATFTIIHPIVDTFPNQTWQQGIYTDVDGIYVLGNAYGPVSQSMIDYHKQILQQNLSDGGADDDENVIGESLELFFFMHESQQNQVEKIFDPLGNSTFVWYHQAGTVSYTSFSQGPQYDLAGYTLLVANRAGDQLIADNTFAGSALYANALEGGIIQQLLPITGVSATKMLDTANSLGQKLFTGNILTWGSVRDQLVNWEDVLPTLDFMVDSLYTLIIHENGATSVDMYEGGGWLAIFGPAIGGLLRGQIMGGTGGEPASKAQTNQAGLKSPSPTNSGTFGPNGQQISPDPVGLYSGDSYYNKMDFSVGSGRFPYSLEFSRAYNSGNRFLDGPLGLAWTHNFATSATETSNGFRAAGETSAKEAAATIAHAYVSIQLALGLGFGSSTINILIAAIAVQWLMDELFTNNAVVISDVGQSRTFIKLVDGSYGPPPAYADTVIKNLDGSFSFKNAQQQEWNFNTEGKISTFVDPAGVTVTYSYDTNQKLTSVTNGLDRTLSFAYSGERLASVSDGNGRAVSFTIDGSSNLTEFTDAEGKSTTYEYALPGQMTKIFLPANPAIAVVTNQYDSLGRVMSQTGSNTGTTSFYLAGSRAEQVDPLGNQSILYNNSLGSVIKNINALGQVRLFEYDGLNRLTKMTYPELNATEWIYDQNNNVLSVTQKAKPGSGLSDIVQSMSYDPAWNKVASYTDGNGNTTSFAYDVSQGTLLTITRPVVDSQTPVITFTFNARGQVLTRTDETGIVDKFDYDSGNETLLAATHDFGVGRLNLLTAFAYDAVGNVSVLTDPNGNTTSFSFDNERRLLEQVDPAPFAYVSNWEYNENGWQTAFKRQTGIPAQPFQTWLWQYQENGSVTEITDPAGNPLSFEYNTNNLLIKRTDAENRIWLYDYDPLYRVSTVTDPLGHLSETRAYTENGRLASIEDANNNVTNYEYDGFDRLDKRIYPDSSFEQYEYDDNANILNFRTRNADDISNTFDSLNRLRTRQPGALALQSLNYDLAGRMTMISTPVSPGDPGSGDFSYFYDTAGRLFQQRRPDSRNVTYELDDNGNRTRLTYPDGFYAEYFYDSLNRLTDIKLNGDTNAAVHMDYDDLSRRTLLTYENGCQCAYAYEINDDLSNLAKTFVGSSFSINFDYNKVHQVIGLAIDDSAFLWTPELSSVTSYANANDLNQYPAVDATGYTYNNNGCLTGGLLAASFDLLNRMTQAVSGSSVIDYLYDPTNRQAQKAVNGVKTGFLYDGQQLIEEHDDVGDLAYRYIRGNRLDEVFLKIAGSNRTYLHHDRLGSVIALSDESGALLQALKYSPFGQTESLVGTAFGYTGQRYDSEVGLYNYRARVYAPLIGRFLQPDPIGFDAGDLNLYSYVGNDAANFMDPNGTNPVDNAWNNFLVNTPQVPQQAGDFSAGFGDYFSLGLSSIARDLVGKALNVDPGVNTSSPAYHAGEGAAAAIDIAATAGSGALRHAAAEVTRGEMGAIRTAARESLGLERGDNLFAHHVNPLKGHPLFNEGVGVLQGEMTLFPTAGLPDFIRNASWNLKALTRAEHTAEHARFAQWELLARSLGIANESVTALRHVRMQVRRAKGAR